METTPLGAAPFDWEPPKTNGFEDLAAFLEEHQARLDFPSLGAAVMTSDAIIAAGVTGRRKLDDETPVTITDKYHIGSITKSFTSLLAVLMADEGKIALTNTISQVLTNEMRDAYHGVTLEMLLQHRSGLQMQAPPDLWKKAWEFSGDEASQRARFLPEVLMLEPEVEPGAKTHYSNLGYAIAGVMLETVAGKKWEDLVRERIFQPLQMHGAGFGPTHSPDEVDQPWGHSLKDGSFEVAPRADNPPAIAPGGRIHCSILDLAKYCAFHLALAGGKVPELNDWADRLYTPPPGNDYALGWVVVERNWAGGKALTHTGTNTMFYCLVWLAPERDIGFIVVTNAGERGDSNRIHQGCDGVVAALIKRCLPPR